MQQKSRRNPFCHARIHTFPNLLVWKHLDGDEKKRSIHHPKIIFEMGKERFGFKMNQRESKHTFGPSRRQKKCEDLRQDINRLKQAYYEAPQEEKKAIQQVLDSRKCGETSEGKVCCDVTQGKILLH